MANGIELLGFTELVIDLIEPPTIKKSVNHVYCISVLFNMLGFSQKELMCFSLGEFVSACGVRSLKGLIGILNPVWERGLACAFHNPSQSTIHYT
ncbi:hypothetical protein [Haloarcula marismortui]|uniref:Uncharacterized protein n=2 Tax=Haloarcula marismortui TaxID=2238 RepID=A0A8T8KMC7_9EURY|nr:hypothetical protein [Haloarcula sinaiiensis]QUJ74984.1 hypothetical protein KDQ40_22310 [Haloarcula sinaiiensis ATCC 33800]